MTNIAFYELVYFYPRGGNIFTTRPYDKTPLLYWGEEIGHTEMTRKQFTALVLNGEIVRIGEL
ncbi:MAG: hypothetical protein CL529_12065 [Aequorivita sp.]|nr:hypothetical protein [Aequorivita sp.]|tara:strand:+ start:3663 stop:3851 length:189 start_codon:yes stop_codon:yes gene_type:complete